jgi:hypothetical protein
MPPDANNGIEHPSFTTLGGIRQRRAELDLPPQPPEPDPGSPHTPDPATPQLSAGPCWGKPPCNRSQGSPSVPSLRTPKPIRPPLSSSCWLSLATSSAADPLHGRRHPAPSRAARRRHQPRLSPGLAPQRHSRRSRLQLPRRLPHLQAALAVWDCSTSASLLVGDSTGNSVADRMREALEATPDGLSRNETRGLFHGHVHCNRIDAPLEQPVVRDAASCHREVTGGRPSILWSATAREKQEENEPLEANLNDWQAEEAHLELSQARGSPQGT